MNYSDVPRVWEEPIDDEEIIVENLPAEIETVPVLTIAQQENVIKESTISKEGKSMLTELVEMNNIAATLTAINNEETIEQRKSVIHAWCENFIHARMRNNATTETLKNALIMRLLSNVESLDLETAATILQNLHDVSSVDAQQAMSTVMGGGTGGAGNSGVTVNLNNITGENATIATQTLNANGEQVTHLKETASMNNAIRSWGEIPTKAIDTKE